MNKPLELRPPPSVHTASKATEVARIWIVDGHQHVAISGNLWKDPAAWGLMLVDLAKHVANAYAQNGADREATLNRILAGFRAEMESSTDEPRPINPNSNF
jgi:Domain of unknown function (DUF5076)